jgi:hypothetical protein
MPVPLALGRLGETRAPICAKRVDAYLKVRQGRFHRLSLHFESEPASESEGSFGG